MKSVVNKTQKPVSVPLPRGKTLHLGPGKTGQVSAEGAEHAGLRKLVAEGTIEIVDEGPRSAGAIGGSKGGAGGPAGHARGGGGRRSGDR